MDGTSDKSRLWCLSFGFPFTPSSNLYLLYILSLQCTITTIYYHYIISTLPISFRKTHQIWEHVVIKWWRSSFPSLDLRFRSPDVTSLNCHFLFLWVFQSILPIGKKKNRETDWSCFLGCFLFSTASSSTLNSFRPLTGHYSFTSPLGELGGLGE